MSEEKVWTVSELNRSVRELIEDGFFPIWLSGEIGNLTIHRSGHVYFTLKDEKSQLSGVYFNGGAAARKLNIREGMEIEVYGALTVYEPRGNYQISVRNMRPKGMGSLQMQFEELKARLQEQGLFDEARKKRIPLLPKCVGVVTSPEGAAVQDFFNVLQRRFSDIHVRIIPAAVQGAGAAEALAAGVDYFNATQGCDVIIVTRGGGSLEDLWAFNEEVLAQAIARSTIPVISAVGHEVDFTIADFVADMRVPTPSAAAELVVGQKSAYEEQISNYQQRLSNALTLKVSRMKQRVERVSGSFVFREPMRLVQMAQQRCDDLQMRLTTALQRKEELAKMRLQSLDAERRMEQALQKNVEMAKFRLNSIDAERRMENVLHQRVEVMRTAVKSFENQLKILNPKGVLERGYAIVKDVEADKILMSPDDVESGKELQVMLANGEMRVVKQ